MIVVRTNSAKDNSTLIANESYLIKTPMQKVLTDSMAVISKHTK